MIGLIFSFFLTTEKLDDGIRGQDFDLEKKEKASTKSHLKEFIWWTLLFLLQGYVRSIW